MHNYFKMFFRRISKDFKQKQLLPLKLLFFMHSSTILVLYPYLTIHMRELGINVEETAIMSAVIPVIALLMPPLAGILADKIGNFRVLLACFSALGGASALLLLLVPVGRVTIIYPERVEFSMSCTPGNPLVLSMYQQHSCKLLEEQNQTDFQFESCGFACQAILSENQTNKVLRTSSYGLQIHDLKRNNTKTYTYTLGKEDIYVPVPISTKLNHEILKNNERYLSSVRRISKNSFYFPTPTLLNFLCDMGNTDSQVKCIFGTWDLMENFRTRLGISFDIKLQHLNQTQDDIMEERQLFEFLLFQNRTTSCVDGFVKNGQHISITIPLDEDKKVLDLGSCAPRCLATSPRKTVCSNKDIVVERDMKVTFWSYLVVRVFVGIASGTSFAMFEGAVIAILREHKADYGLQRIYSTIGGMISSPLSGFLIDWASRGKGYIDFRPIFFLYAILKISSASLMLFINLEFKTPANSVVSDVIEVLKKIELIALFIACLILGSSWGYIESFLFWLLQDLGGSRTLMGLTITVGGLVGIPLLVLSGPIIKRFGHANIIFLAFVFYAIRLMGYSLIYNPWLCLIFEAMEAVTVGLGFTAAVTYAARLSTVTTDATIQGMLGGLYYGVGKGVGSLIGGYLIKSFGIRFTFQKFAIFSAVTGVMYVAFYHLYMKKRRSVGTDITKKDVEKPPQGFVDVDLDVNGKSPIHPEIPAMYEDALVNPAYEDTEFDENGQTGKDGEEKNNSKVNVNSSS